MAWGQLRLVSEHGYHLGATDCDQAPKARYICTQGTYFRSISPMLRIILNKAVTRKSVVDQTDDKKSTWCSNHWCGPCSRKPRKNRLTMQCEEDREDKREDLHTLLCHDG